MLTVTVMMLMMITMMMLLNFAMNKTAEAVALGATERIDGIRRQVSRLSDRAPSLLVSSDCYLDSESVLVKFNNKYK